MKNKKKPVLLCILDGFGIGDDLANDNAIARAEMENYQRILQSYPNSKLLTSGLDVGLPKGQIGNSEVGHMTIGAGRIIFQDLPRINNAISKGSLANNDKIIKLIANLKQSGKACHLMGLLSDGGVHAHIDHIIFLANLLKENGLKVFVHAILDGRDVAQKSALEFINKVDNVATISGRYYTMDRDNKWDRIKPSYDAIVNGEGEKFSDKTSAINNSYENNITDEFLVPCSYESYSGIEDGDALLFCNFRADRARQISDAILDENFNEFETRKIEFSNKLSMSKYSEKLAEIYDVILEETKVKNSLPEVLSQNNLTQLRVAETEKYAHVTFFFSCGKEQEFKGEKRVLIQSPDVKTYDLQPEMSAKEVGEKLVSSINSGEFDFIVVNYANPDMVGHSGILDASIKACKTIDEELKNLEKAILENDGKMLITADHGNIECMLDKNQKPHTAHTTNPVPFVLIGNNIEGKKMQDGRLSDIAPTILKLMNIGQPKEMEGNNLIT